MNPVALVIGLIACVAIIVLGIRFFLQPRQATLDFGIPADSLRGLTEIRALATSRRGWCRSGSGHRRVRQRWAGFWWPPLSRRSRTD
jgi:hypothetical protein